MDVLGVRPDGYHEVETVMQSLSLSDEITVEWKASPGSGETFIDLSCSHPDVPLDGRNLAVKAVFLMGEAYKEHGLGETPEGELTIDIRKSIPVAAGLAGGSGNAASVVIALNELWDMGLSVTEMCEISSKLGADVPFTLLSQATGTRCALGSGTGTELTPLKNEVDFSVLLVNPGFGVSTPEVYRGMDAIPEDEKTHPDTDVLREALEKGDRDAAYRAMGNALEDYTLKAYPEVDKIKSDMKETEGLRLTMMSGSGPTVIGFFDNMEDAARAALKFRDSGYTVATASKV